MLQCSKAHRRFYRAEHWASGPPMADQPAPAPKEPKPSKDLGPLRMIWRETFKYKRQVGFAFLALLTASAATLAIPYRFKSIIDDAFGSGADIGAINHSFQYLMMIVVVL